MGKREVIMSDEIAMTKEMLNQMQAFDWKVYLPSVKSKRSCLIAASDRLVSFDVDNNEVGIAGDRLTTNAYFIALDPAIDWHRDLIEMQLLEEL